LSFVIKYAIIKKKYQEDFGYMKKIFAFTLAEVLLTMTIVGVIAAMTIPTLHYQRVKKEYSAKLKNFYSRMDNAILDMQADKGSFTDMIKPEDMDTEKGFQWYIDNVDPYMGHQFVDTAHKRIYFKDGSSIVTIYPGGCLDIVYDTNGDRAPNREGYDRYRFLMCFTKETRTRWFGNENVFWGAYGGGLTDRSVTREQMIEKCEKGVQNADTGEYTQAGSWCTRLLQNDQWEFKEDYPFKF